MLPTRTAARLLAALAALGVTVGCRSERPPSKAALRLTPGAVSTSVGSSTSLTYVVLNEQGLPIGQRCLKFDISDSSRVRLDRTGTSFLAATGLRPGFALITARCLGIDRRATASVTVRPEGAGPGLEPRFATFFGGRDDEDPGDIAVDARGDVIVVGTTRSADFPATPGTLGPRHHSGTSYPNDAFVAKLDSTGAVKWATVLGGPGFDAANAVEVDDAGFIYVAGDAGEGFPVTAGAFQQTFSGGRRSARRGDVDGFVCKLRPDGSAAVWCSYFGGPDGLGVGDLALAPDGDVVIAGTITREGVPDAARAARPVPAGGTDIVVAKVSGDGRRLRWASYVGGPADEGPTASVRVGPDGDIWVLTETRSPGVATPGAYQPALAGPSDLLVARLAAGGDALRWATYLGGSAAEREAMHNLAVTAAGEAVLVGVTASNDFPTTAGAWQREAYRTRDIEPTTIAARLSPDGRRLLASTFLGGTKGNWTSGLAIDAEGRLYLAGATLSADHPLTVPGGVGVKTDVVVSVLSPELDRLEFAMRFPGKDEDAARGVALDRAGNLYVNVYTKSPDWPVVRAKVATQPGWLDLVVLRMEPVR